MKCWGLTMYLCAVTIGLPASPVIPVPVSVGSTGFVSLALIDTNGVLVRNLAYAEAVSSGTRTFFWDGTTDLGLPAPAGDYTTRAVFFTNVPSVNFVMNSSAKPSPTG